MLVLVGQVSLPGSEGAVSTTIDGVVNSRAAVKIFVARPNKSGPAVIDSPSNWEDIDSKTIQPKSHSNFRASNYVNLAPDEVLETGPFKVSMRMSLSPGTVRPTVTIERIEIVATRFPSNPLTFPDMPENVTLLVNKQSTLAFEVLNKRDDLRTVKAWLRLQRRTGSPSIARQYQTDVVFDASGTGKATFELRPSGPGSYVGQLSIDEFNRPQIPFGLQVGKPSRSSPLRIALVAFGVVLLTIGAAFIKGQQPESK